MSRTLHHSGMFALAALAMLVVASIWAAGEAEGQPAATASFADRVGLLSLHVGEVETATLPNLLVDLPERFDDSRHYIVQLDGPIDPSRRAELESAGVELLDYIPHFAYIARLGDADPTRLAGVSFVGWVGEFPDTWKLDVEFGTRVLTSPERQELVAAGRLPILVTLFAGLPAETAYATLENDLGGDVHWIEPVSGNIVMGVTIPEDSIDAVVALPSVQFVEDAPEITMRNNSNRWIVQSNLTNVTPFYTAGIRGEDQIVGVLDGRVNVNHCSFQDSQPFGSSHRKIQAYNSSTGSDTHGTHVAGTATGDGGSNTHTRGVAYLGKLCYNTVPSFSESGIRQRLDLHHNQGSRIHTNSWGDDGTTSYNGLARGFDSFSRDFEESLVCLAVTNGSSLRNPENAKNLLAVGASQDTPSQGSHCSGGTGPTADNRRKPEIYAPGCFTNSSQGSGCSTTQLTGTSMACPAVAGTGMLVRQYYTDGYYPTGAPVVLDAFTPSGALVKATLLNSSVDMTGIGGYPSNTEGWGRVLADDACFFTGDSRKLVVFDDVRNGDGLSTNDFVEYPLEVQSAQKLKVTLVFTDVPASSGTGSGFAAVNDLDLEVVSPGGQVYRGNVFSGGQSTTGGSGDIRNNVEQVHLNVPQIGSWTVRVRASAVNSGTQGYALLATGDVVPEEPALRITLPNEAPERISSYQPTEFAVVIEDAAETLVGGTAMVHYRYNGGAYLTSPLTAEGGTLFTASLPPADCGDSPEFYVSAQGNGGTTVTNPRSAPSQVYSADVLDESIYFEDDFETDKGWTVQNLSLDDGAWERGVPAGGGGQGDPPTDADGSGQCYVTGLGVGEDVDGGLTRLDSPSVNLAGTDTTVFYSAWFTDSLSNHALEVQVSPNGGFSWTPVETITGTSGWQDYSFRVNDFITPTGNVKVRFAIEEQFGSGTIEGGVDAVRFLSLGCNDSSSITTCGVGAVNVGCGPVENVLTVNGSTGGAERTLNVGSSTPMSFVLDEASAESGDGQPEGAILYFWYAEPQPGDVVMLPKNLGAMCFGPKLVETRPADLIFNSIGFNGKAGAHNAPVSPPSVPDGGTLEFYSLPSGFGAPMSVTIQGLVPDACTQGNLPFSVTNGILIRVF